METTTAGSPPFIPIPDYPTGYPNPKRKLGQAWAHAWAELTAAGTEWTDGVMLADVTAEDAGLQKNTMISLFTRAATAGLLERTHKNAATTRGVRQRTFYRIPVKS
jgi:hypothetical protein